MPFLSLGQLGAAFIMGVASASGGLVGDSVRQQRERFLVFHLTRFALALAVVLEGIHLLLVLPVVDRGGYGQRARVLGPD